MATTSTTTKPDLAAAGDTDRVAALGAAVTDVAGSVRDAASDVATRLPEVATTTRSMIEGANREMQAGSDEMLVVGSALTFGLAGGLLIGGANRLLVAMAMMPAAIMVLTVMGRSPSKRAQAARRLQGS
jgi:hypothetical protein